MNYVWNRRKCVRTYAGGGGGGGRWLCRTQEDTGMSLVHLSPGALARGTGGTGGGALTEGGPPPSAREATTID